VTKLLKLWNPIVKIVVQENITPQLVVDPIASIAKVHKALDPLRVLGVLRVHLLTAVLAKIVLRVTFLFLKT
jgi:hypothetical protein